MLTGKMCLKRTRGRLCQNRPYAADEYHLVALSIGSTLLLLILTGLMHLNCPFHFD